MKRRGVLTAVMAAGLLCAACGCQSNGGAEPEEAVESPGEAGTWRPGEWARAAILADGQYRVQQETTADVNAVAGLLKKAGAIAGEPIVVDAPVEAGLAAVQTLRAALKAGGFELVWYQTGPHETILPEETFGGGFMPWAQEQGFDTSTAPVVLTAEVAAVDYRGNADDAPSKADAWADFRVHECLKLDRQAGAAVREDQWFDPGKHKRFITFGADGLWPGDKVLILLEEYEGGLAIPPRTGGGCRLGVRLSGWDDPVIEAVRFAIAQGMDKALSHERYGPMLRKIGATAADEVEQEE